MEILIFISIFVCGIIWLILNNYIDDYFLIDNSHDKLLKIITFTTIIPLFNIMVLVMYLFALYSDRYNVPCKIIYPKNKIEEIIFNFWNK